MLAWSRAGAGSWWSKVTLWAGCSTSVMEMSLLPGVPGPPGAPACLWSPLPVPVPASSSQLSLPVPAQPVPTCLPCCSSHSFKGNCVFASRAANKHLNYHCSIFLHIKSHQKSNQLHPNRETELWFSPSGFLFAGSSHEKPLACAMDLSRVVNHCQQLVSCKNTVLLDAPCNSGLHVLPPCCSCLYL